MDPDEMPRIYSCRQYSSNENVFEFIDIVDKVGEISKLIKAAEKEAHVHTDPYYYYFFLEVYNHSFKRFIENPLLMSKYYLRYLVHEAQVDKFNEKENFSINKTAHCKSLPVVAAYTLYTTIFFSVEVALEFLTLLHTSESQTIATYLRDGLFDKIIEIMDDFLYMPYICPPPSDEVIKLRDIYNLQKDLPSDLYNTSVRAILGLQGLNAQEAVDAAVELLPLEIEAQVAAEAVDAEMPLLQLEIDAQVAVEAEAIDEHAPLEMDANKPIEYTDDYDLSHNGTVIEKIQKPHAEEPIVNKNVTPFRKSRNDKESTKLSSEMKSQENGIQTGFKTPSNCIRRSHWNRESQYKNKLYVEPRKTPRTGQKSTKFSSYASPCPLSRASPFRDMSNTYSNDSDESFESPTSSNLLNKAFINTSFEDNTVKENLIICSPFLANRARRMAPEPIIEEEEDFIEMLNGSVEDVDRFNQSVTCIDMTFSETASLPTFGLYKCTQFIGSGSFSKVYEAVKQGDSSKYAVKVLRFDESQPKSSVMNELYIMGIMSKTGKAIHLVDSFISAKGAIIIMEKAITDMKNFLTKREKSIDVDFILTYWKAMMKCVCALHDNKIAHLDLKLQNFVITEDLTVKLIDFGISKFLHEADTMRIAESIGTIVFMSPELLMESKVIMPYKCDIWSMGIVLYVMIFDMQPVSASTFEEYTVKMTAENFVFPYPNCDRNCDLFKAIMHLCLQREPRDRKSAQEILSAIDRTCLLTNDSTTSL